MDAPRVLVTGGTGFVGPYLCRAIRTQLPDAELFVTSHTHPTDSSCASEVSTVMSHLDVTEPQSVARCVRTMEPTHIIHLAAQSHVPTAFEDPAGTWQVNVFGTLNLLEEIRREKPDSAFLFVSSGDIYGRSFRPQQLVDETSLMQPENPYSSSKAAADLLVRQYGYQGLKTFCLRAFNHVGPGQRPDFVVSAFARQIADIEAGRQESVIRVGNLEAWRDFLDVRDVVRAYVTVLERSDDIAAGEVFNVCSGNPRQISQILDDLINASGADITVEQDPDRLRPSDTPFAAGDPTQLRVSCDWEPRIPWEQTIRELLEYWRRAPVKPE